MGGILSPHECAVRLLTGNMLSRGCDPGGVYSPFYIYILVFPQDLLIEVVILTNINLSSKTENKTDPITPEKLLKWIGILILVTRI